jgi:hypothetical protein
VVLWVWFFGCATSPQVAVLEGDERAAGMADARVTRDARRPELARKQGKGPPAGWGWATRPLEYLETLVRQETRWTGRTPPRSRASTQRCLGRRLAAGRRRATLTFLYSRSGRVLSWTGTGCRTETS